MTIPPTAPTACPFQKERLPRPEARRPLLDVVPGESACIRCCKEDSELMDYLQDSGITMGMEITMEAKEPYEGPVIFRSGGQKYILSYKAAAQLFVDNR